MQSKAATVDTYIEELPEERKDVVISGYNSHTYYDRTIINI